MIAFGLFFIITCDDFALSNDSASSTVWSLNQFSDGSAEVHARTMVGTNIELLPEENDEITFYEKTKSPACNAEIVTLCFQKHTTREGFWGQARGFKFDSWWINGDVISVTKACGENLLYSADDSRCRSLRTEEQAIELSEKVFLVQGKNHIKFNSKITTKKQQVEGTAVWSGDQFPSRLWRLGVYMSLSCAYTKAPSVAPSRLISNINNIGVELYLSGLGVNFLPGYTDPEIPKFDVPSSLDRFHRWEPISKLNGWWHCGETK
jgi:hypothetical protein